MTICANIVDKVKYILTKLKKYDILLGLTK